MARRTFLVAALVGVLASNAATQTPQPAATSAFAQSLALRLDRVIADQTHPMMAWLAQTNPASYSAQGALRLKLALRAASADGAIAKDLGQTLIFGGDLALHPFPIALNLRDVSSGDYRVAGELRDGDVALKTFDVPVKL